jgi:hypothetical protein
MLIDGSERSIRFRALGKGAEWMERGKWGVKELEAQVHNDHQLRLKYHELKAGRLYPRLGTSYSNGFRFRWSEM